MISNYQYYIKKLNEGLISTYPISKYFENLKTSIELITECEFVIAPNFDKETFKIDINQHISFDEIRKINAICNNFGYFISKFEIFINSKSNFLKYKNDTFENDIKNNERLILFYESKFDTEIVVPQKIYHATNITHLEKIMKHGLLPRSTSKLQYHLDRIYFSLTFNDCENIINKLRTFDKSNVDDYIILEIDTTNFYENNFNDSKTLVKFRIDSQSNGIYTFSSIPKNRITLLKKIYQKNKIIPFDKIEIQKNNILIYNNNELSYEVNLKNK